MAKSRLTLEETKDIFLYSTEIENLFINEFRKLRDSLAIGDTDALRDQMKLSTERRSYFDRK